VTVVQLLLALRSRSVKVWVSGGELRYDAPPGALDDALREQLDANAVAVARYLTDSGDYEHSTRYFITGDGARLAVDLFRPVRDGTVVSEPLPVLWCQDRYHRAELSDGMVVTKLDIWPWLREVLRHGYVIAAVDGRGSGASTGTRTSEFSVQERQDAYEVTEWLAAQPWCNQRVGMFGDSYLGIAQFLAAATAPPHLKAIFPQMAAFDLYSFLYPGGVFRDDFVRNWGVMVRRLDSGASAAPVAGAEHLADFIAAEHLGNDDVLSRAVANPFRDSIDEVLGAAPYAEYSPSGLLAAIQSAAVPVYQLSGWMDLWVRDALCWYANLTGPQRLLITADSHNTRTEVDLAAEHVRWFDYWLKDAGNGMLDGPPITYRVLNARPGREWRSAWEWPPAGQLTSFYFRAGPTGTIGSGNDGLLATEPPSPLDAPDEYVVDYSASTGRGSRWAAGYGSEFGYPDLTENDSKGLTYTSAPLLADIEVAGHPVAHVWMTTSYSDADLFVYLELVEPDGASRYISEGVLRGSHRALDQPPFRYLGLPYHSGAAAQVTDLPPTAVEFVLDLHPTACVFRAGQRIRITLAGCDRDNASTPAHHPPPVLQVLRHGRFASRVDLPLLPRQPREPAAERESPSL
jgi:uncharacterized protein